MLVLSRKIGEVIMIGSSIKVRVLSFDRGVVRLGIEAPKSIPVHRQEVYDKIIKMNKQAAKTDLSALKSLIVSTEIEFQEGDQNKADAPSVAFRRNQNKSEE